MTSRTIYPALFALLGAPLVFAQTPATTPTIEQQQRALAQLNAARAAPVSSQATLNATITASLEGSQRQAISASHDDAFVRIDQKAQDSEARLAALRNHLSQLDSLEGAADGNDGYEAIANQLKTLSRLGIEGASRSFPSPKSEHGGAASGSTPATNAAQLDLSRNIAQELLANTSGSPSTSAQAPGFGAQSLAVANGLMTDQHRAKLERWVRKNEPKIRRYVNDSNPELKSAANQTLKMFGLFKDEPLFSGSQPPPMSTPALVPPGTVTAPPSAVAPSAANSEPAPASGVAAKNGDPAAR